MNSSSFMSRSREEKLELIKDEMNMVAAFLVNYLPLANVHNSDFIVHSHWDKMMPANIADDLLSLNDEELARLPSGISYNADFESNDDTLGRNESTDLTSLNLKLSNGENSDNPPEWDRKLLPNWVHSSLKDFVVDTCCKSLPNLGFVHGTDDLKRYFGCLIELECDRVVIGDFMSIKKHYEVDLMASLCSSLAKCLNINKVVDLGSGLGYLGCYLTLMHNMPVLGVDSSSNNTAGAEKRTKLLKKQWHGLLRKAKLKLGDKKENIAADQDPPVSSRQRCSLPVENLFRPVTKYVTPDTKLDKLYSDAFSEQDKEHNVKENNEDIADTCSPALVSKSGGLMLTGLHTCGDLSASILKLFIDSETASVLCQVGCCYNLMTERFLHNAYLPYENWDQFGFPLSSSLQQRQCQIGRNARTLAAQSPGRLAVVSKSPPISLYWRSLLQVILMEHCCCSSEYEPDSWKVGKIAEKCNTFVEYVHLAFKKLNLPGQLSEEEINGYLMKYDDQKRKCLAFYQLRVTLGKCVETLIILDRIAYLLEQEVIKDVFLVQMFDPVISPRCYGIVATKCDQTS